MWGAWRLGDPGDARRDEPEAAPRSVAVLPFANVGRDAEAEYLSIGLSDQILTDLARIGDLNVVARTSSFAFKDSCEDVRSIGRQLGARAVLEGSVQRSGDRLRVTTQLDPELAEAHSARGAVLLAAGRLAEAEEAFVTAAQLDPRLFEARYFHGRSCFQRGSYDEAAKLFQEASDLREDYPAAFFAAQAMEASGRREEALAAYAVALTTAERHMELNPDDARAATMRAVSLCRLGRRDEGVEWAERALDADPDDSSVRYNVACLFSVAGEVERALECLDAVVRGGFGHRDWLERDPDLDSIRGDPRFAQIMGGAAEPKARS